jgi:hypothetical protein
LKDCPDYKIGTVEMHKALIGNNSNNRNNILKTIIVILSILYCYLATLPKHSDFWFLNYAGKNFIYNGFDVYKIFSNQGGTVVSNMHPPAFYIIQGIWIKLGASLFGIDYSSWDNPMVQPLIFQLWGMIPYLLVLFALVILAYYTLNNKWLSLLCYGTFTFISVIVMGQTDIFCAFFIYLSLLFALKSFIGENPIFYSLLSLITLGLSMTFKFYGGLLFPVYILFFFFMNKFRLKSAYKVYGITAMLIFVFVLSFMFVWIPYAKWFGNLSHGGETSWLFNLQLNPLSLPPFHNISIWLLGYLIILYDLVHNMMNKPNDLYADKRYFIFFSFATISWFFVSVLTNPQWWIILIPPMLLVLDTFHNKFNYFFACSILALFWFYPMMWVNNIDKILNNYIAVVPIEGNFATILSTSMVAVLLAWMIELRTELTSNSNETIGTCIFTKIELAMPAIIIFLIIIIFMYIFVPHVVIQYEINQPVGEIFGNITVGQTFFAPYSNLDAIDIELVTYARVNTKDIIFHLRSSPTSTIDLFSSKVNARQIGDNSYHRFSFPKISESKDNSYYLFIESPESSPGNAITIWSSSEDVYKDGSMYMNNRPVGGDLAFKTYYSKF